MCGIAGIIRFDGRTVRRDEIAAMIGSIRHRGPDDEGLLVEDGLGIGMRRLSIVDLAALQATNRSTNEDHSVAVVFNGEIYNHRDIRFRGSGVSDHVFRGTSDTEVLVHGYEQLGASELVRRLAGMFAFALYDRRRRKLFLARDGFGIKPLYLRRTGRQLSFASEIRALAFDGEGPLSIEPTFTRTYLRIGYVPSPGTAFAGITKLAPGTLHEIDLATGETKVETFYRLAPAPEEDTRPDSRCSNAFASCSTLRSGSTLMADVPTGLFLSGGLDSSALDGWSTRIVTPRRPRPFPSGFRRPIGATRPPSPRRSRVGPATRTSGSTSARRTSTISARSSARWRSRWLTARSCRSGISAAGPPGTSRSRSPARAVTRSLAVTPAISGGTS